MVLDRRKRLGDRREPYKRLAKIKYYPGSLPRDCVVTDVSERSVNVVVEDDDVPAEFHPHLLEATRACVACDGDGATNSEPSLLIVSDADDGGAGGLRAGSGKSVPDDKWNFPDNGDKHRDQDAGPTHRPSRRR